MSEEENSINFGDFTPEECQKIKHLANEIHSEFARSKKSNKRHFTDALKFESTEDQKKPNQIVDGEKQNSSDWDEGISIHASNVDSLDEDIFDPTRNSTKNNNENGTTPTTTRPTEGREVDHFHSIPQLTNRSSIQVIPETPKAQRERKIISRPIRLQISRSEGNLKPAQNERPDDISIEMSETVVPNINSVESINDPTTPERLFAPPIFVHSANAAIMNDRKNDTTTDEVARRINTNQVNSDKMTSTSKLIRFEHNVTQTSKTNTGVLKNSMREFSYFADSLTLDIKRSQFNVNDSPISQPVNRTLFLQNPNLNRIDVRIYPQALNCWRNLRNQQTKKIEYELRMTYNEKLLSTDHFPEWAVTFNPQPNLLSTAKAVECVAGFRYEQAKRNITMLNDLMREECFSTKTICR